MHRSSDPDIIRPYLEDASNLTGGYASEVVFPEDEKEVSQILQEASHKKIPVTVAGNGTGLTGARIPFGGIVLSTEKLGGIQEIKVQESEKKGFAIVGAATTLRELQEAISQKGLLYPPDPTEQNAFIGASVSTNASGARSFKYGATRRWIRRLRVVLADGAILDLSRGENKADSGGKLKLKTGNRSIEIPVPRYQMPKVKHAAGYYAADGMDAVDFFIGAEGTLGVVTQVELELTPKPKQLFSGVVFFVREEDCWELVDEVRKNRNGLRALEYLDSQALSLIREKHPQIPAKAAAALFFEEEVMATTPEKVMDHWFGICQRYGALVDESWFATTPSEQEEFRRFRYTIPVQVNEIVHQLHQTKVGTDFAVPNEHYFDMLKSYRSQLQTSGLLYCLFGHIGDNHLHINLLPRDEEESKQAWFLYHKIATQVIRWGGTISAEHGVGKIRREYLLAMYGRKGLEEMAQVKKVLDPSVILGRGNIFPKGFLDELKIS